jgi:hypothetical protein
MTGDTYAMSQEIIELQTRVSELMVALERVTEQRDNALTQPSHYTKNSKRVVNESNHSADN